MSGSSRKRQPQIHGPELTQIELGARDAEDGVRGAGERDRRAEDGRIAAEPPLPERRGSARTVGAAPGRSSSRAKRTAGGERRTKNAGTRFAVTCLAATTPWHVAVRVAHGGVRAGGDVLERVDEARVQSAKLAGDPVEDVLGLVADVEVIPRYEELAIPVPHPSLGMELCADGDRLPPERSWYGRRPDRVFPCIAL